MSFCEFHITTFAVNQFHAFASLKDLRHASLSAIILLRAPFIVIDWAGGSASEGSWKSILFMGLVPTKSLTFAVLQF